MIVLEAYIYIYRESVKGTSLMSGARCSLHISGNTHICKIDNYKDADILLEKETKVVIMIPSGEISLLELKEGAKFFLYKGRRVGEGVVADVKEVYVEKEVMECINDKEKQNQIISYAEKLSNAIIYEEVYELLGMDQQQS